MKTLCPICRSSLGESAAVCRSCETPHHPDCWEFNGGCAVFACGQNRARLVPVSDLAVTDQTPLRLDDSLPDPAKESLVPPIPRTETGHRESLAVVLVSWIYLTVSLMAAIPAAGYLLDGLTTGRVDPLICGLVLGVVAMSLKTVGDLVAVGDPKGRQFHICFCILLGLTLYNIIPPILPVLLVGPFISGRGSAHFGLSDDED